MNEREIWNGAGVWFEVFFCSHALCISCCTNARPEPFLNLTKEDTNTLERPTHAQKVRHIQPEVELQQEKRAAKRTTNKVARLCWLAGCGEEKKNSRECVWIEIQNGWISNVWNILLVMFMKQPRIAHTTHHERKERELKKQRVKKQKKWQALRSRKKTQK